MAYMVSIGYISEAQRVKVRILTSPSINLSHEATSRCKYSER